MYVLWIIFDNCVSALTIFRHLRSVKAKICIFQERNARDREYQLTEKKILNNSLIVMVNYFF